MKKIFPFIFFVLLTVAFISCKEKGEINVNRHLWGELRCYKYFPFKPFVSDTLRKTIKLEFNQYAIDSVTNIKLQLFEKITKRKSDTYETETSYSESTGVILLKNGNLCENNILFISPQDEKMEIGILLHQKTEIKNHNYIFVLKVIDSGGLDRIDNTIVSEVNDTKSIFLSDEWEVQKTKIWNPVAKILFWLIVVIVAFLIIWRIFIRPLLFETFKVRALYIICPDSPMKTVRIKGCCKAICSKRKQRQSMINKFFTGRIAYSQNDFWEQDMEIVPRNRKSVRLRLPHGFIAAPSSTLAIGADVKITSTITNKTTILKIN